MSSTRYADPDDELNQEKYASSPEYRRGLLANLVAKRVALLHEREQRDLIWFAQWCSLHGKGAWGGCAGPCRLECLSDACLDPAISLSGYTIDELREHRKQVIAEAAARYVETSVGRQIREALNYTLRARTLTVLTGPSRLGKSFAARAWCDQHPGIARFVQVPPTNDAYGFFRAIAASLGVAINLNSKMVELRERVTQVLQSGDIVLVMDECDYLFGQNNRRYSRFARPERVNWIMSELVNYRVPVALIGLPSFWDEVENARNMGGWQAEQFIGRVRHCERLPDELPLADLEAIARALLPSASAKCIGALAAYAAESQKRIASIESAATRAKYLAEEAGRSEPTDADVKAAVRTSVMPSDGAMVEAMAGRPAGRKHTRRTSVAPSLQVPDRGAATPAADAGNRINFLPQTEPVAD